jgi:hypothetical protein
MELAGWVSPGWALAVEAVVVEGEGAAEAVMVDDA